LREASRLEQKWVKQEDYTKRKEEESEQVRAKIEKRKNYTKRKKEKEKERKRWLKLGNCICIIGLFDKKYKQKQNIIFDFCQNIEQE